VELRYSHALPRGLEVPRKRLREVLGNSQTMLIENPKAVCSVPVPLLGGLAKRGRCLAIITRRYQSSQANGAKRQLRSGVAGVQFETRPKSAGGLFVSAFDLK